MTALSVGEAPSDGLSIEAYWCNKYYAPTENIARVMETWMVDVQPLSPLYVMLQ